MKFKGGRQGRAAGRIRLFSLKKGRGNSFPQRVLRKVGRYDFPGGVFFLFKRGCSGTGKFLV